MAKFGDDVVVNIVVVGDVAFSLICVVLLTGFVVVLIETTSGRLRLRLAIVTIPVQHAATKNTNQIMILLSYVMSTNSL